MKQYGFVALALRQSLISRWSLMRCQQTESVLEHSAVVATLAMIAGEIANANGRGLDIGVMMCHAIVHDVSEVLTGDVVTPVKKASPTLSKEFARLEQAAEEKLLNTLPDWLAERIAVYFDPQCYEQALVKGCDVYAAYLKCKLEVAGGNAVEFQDALEQITVAIERLKKELPEIAELDRLFGDSIGQSVDKLLSNGTQVVNEDSMNNDKENDHETIDKEKAGDYFFGSITPTLNIPSFNDLADLATKFVQMKPNKKLSELYTLWDVFGNIPINSEEETEVPFLHFEPGTHREDVWSWFEEQNPAFIVGEVMLGVRPDKPIDL